MIRLLLALATLCASLAFAQEAAEAPRPKLTVMPFAALTGDVPQRAGAKAVGMLTTEFKSADAFALVDAKKAQAGTAADDALTAARKAVDEAKQLRAKKKFRLAEEALGKGLEAYKAAVTALPEAGELVDAWALLAAVQFNTGRDDEGARSLTQALALAPERPLPLAETSPLFARVVADTRKAVQGGAKGALLLESSPANAPVVLDGVAVGATPLLVQDVPPGLHAWKATLPSGEAVGGLIEVQPGKQALARALSASKDPETRLLTSLAQNRVDAELLAAAKEHAKAAEADLVVFGALSREGKGLTLDAFLFAAASGEVRRMGRAAFDTELLSAGMEFYNLAGDLSKKGPAVGELVKVPSPVSLTLIATGPKQAEVKYGVVPGKGEGGEGLEGAAEPTGKAGDGARKPLEPKRRAPLRRQ